VPQHFLRVEPKVVVQLLRGFLAGWTPVPETWTPPPAGTKRARREEEAAADAAADAATAAAVRAAAAAKKKKKKKKKPNPKPTPSHRATAGPGPASAVGSDALFDTDGADGAPPEDPPAPRRTLTMEQAAQLPAVR
jgi:hypothetical protein